MRASDVLCVVTGVLHVIASANASSAEPAASKIAAARINSPAVLVIAHRGDSKAAPENTLPAFVSAVKAGADLVELDYLHSSDGVPVVFHDDDLDRTTDACQLWGGSKIALSSKSLAELEKLDAGKWFDARFAGIRIPTLSDSLDTIQAGSMTLIERKDGDPATCVELLKRKKLTDEVVVQAFDWDYLEACHKLEPRLVMAALGHKECTSEKLDDVARTGARVVAWEDKYTTASTIAAIHSRGYKAWVWTVDDPARARELVAAKIDGIITNLPAATRRAIAAAAAGK
jgi:glycerophosphoryl diester phosphodiesterase